MKVLPAAILALDGLNLVAPLLAAIVFGFVGFFLTWLLKYHSVSLRLSYAQREERTRLAGRVEEQVFERTRDLQKREEWFRALTELSSDWYWQTDHLGQFTAMSHGVSRFGCDPAEFIGRGRSEFVADPGDQQVRSYEALLAARQAFRDFAFVGNDANGSLRQVRLNGEPFYGDDGAFAGFRGSGRDVTEEVEARAALASREALLAAVYESVEEGIAAFGPDMRVLAWNRPTRRCTVFRRSRFKWEPRSLISPAPTLRRATMGLAIAMGWLMLGLHSLTWNNPRIPNAFALRAQCSRSGLDPWLGAASF